YEIDLIANSLSSKLSGDFQRCSGPEERIEHRLPCECEELDESTWDLVREGGDSFLDSASLWENVRYVPDAQSPVLRVQSQSVYLGGFQNLGGQTLQLFVVEFAILKEQNGFLYVVV